MANVLFKLLTAAQWEALENKDDGTLYRVQKTGGGEDFYIGAKRLNNQADISAAIAALDTQSDVAIATKSGNAVTIVAGVSETDGVIGAGSGTAITLADVAATGDAEDVAYDNTTSGLTATNVKAAIDEVAAQSAGGVDSKTVYITETAGQFADPFSKRYGVYQGSSGSSSSPVPAEKLADIDIPKDMVVEEGAVVDITYNTSDGKLYDGATDVTELIKGAGGTATAADAGKYIRLTIANTASNKLYIAAKDLVDIYTVEQNATQVQLAIDSNNVISATIVAGSIGTTELAGGAVTTAKLDDEAVTTAKIDDDAVTTAKIADENVTLGKLASGVQTSLGLADTAVQSVTESDETTGTNGTITVDGTEVAVKGLGSAAYTASTAYDPAGSASAAQTAAEGYADSAIAAALTWETVTP